MEKVMMKHQPVIPKFACEKWWWRGVHLGIEQMCIKIDIVFSYDDDINFDYSKGILFSL